MTHSSDRASNARNNAHSGVSGATHSKKGTKKMRKFNLSIMLATLIGASFLTTACSDDLNGAAYEPTAFNATANWPAVCEDDAVNDADKPAFCEEGLTVKVSYKTGDTDGNGLQEVASESQELARNAGQLEASVEFAPPPAAAGQYVEAHLDYSGLSLGEIGSIETCDGTDAPTKVDLLPGDEPFELCLRIKHDTSGGNGNNTGSGTGDVCLEAEDTDGMSVDLAPCTVKVNGNVVSGDEDTDGVCPNGMFLDDLDAKNHNFDIECPDNLEGSINTGVAEDKLTPVIVVLEDTTIEPGEDPTTLCLHIGVSNGDPVNLGNCTVKDIAWSNNPLPTAVPPNGVCQDQDALYFDNVKAGDRQYNVTCDEGNVLVPFTIQENVLNDKEVFFAPAGVPGDPCYKDIGDHVDVYGMTLPIQAKLGHYDNSGQVCVLEPNLVDYEAFSITAMTDNGQCNQLGDPACLINVMGAVNDPLFQGSWYQHLVLETTPQQLQTLPAEGKRTHFVTLEDGDAKTVIVPVVVKNGVVQDL